MRPKFKAKKPQAKPLLRRKSTGEAPMFKEIISELAAMKAFKCMVTGASLMKYLEMDEISWVYSTMAHVLPKGKYPLFRLYKDNIRPLDIHIHNQYDNASEGLTDPKWDELLEYRGVLLRQYGIFESCYRLSDLKGMNHKQVTDLIHDTIRQADGKE